MVTQKRTERPDSLDAALHSSAEVPGVLPAVYAVGFLATLAGTIGAFLLERRAEGEPTRLR